RLDRGRLLDQRPAADAEAGRDQRTPEQARAHRGERQHARDPAIGALGDQQVAALTGAAFNGCGPGRKVERSRPGLGAHERIDPGEDAQDSG
ncbi:MAG: hypothetical protein L6R41_004419, partial [Letrouitia leprolyta]